MSPVAVAITIAVVVLALAGMVLSWRRRKGSQRALRLPAAVAGGAEVAEASGTYLATTFDGRPLERVVAAGLGFRAAARLAVTEDGLTIERAGAAPFTVPMSRITGAGSGTWALDRSVERGGLLVVGWSLDSPAGEVRVDSAFRLGEAGQAAVLAALRARMPAPILSPDTQEVRDADRPN